MWQDQPENITSILFGMFPQSGMRLILVLEFLWFDGFGDEEDENEDESLVAVWKGARRSHS
jgi:hypothetical protein